MKKEKEKNKISKSLFWTPRILSIIFILFLALFSLDVFESCNSVLTCFIGLLIHNIPSFVLIIILIISWKKEIVGAIAFALAGIAYIILLLSSQNFEFFMLFWTLPISAPAFIISILFYLNYKRR